jgi:hypothetical protein
MDISIHKSQRTCILHTHTYTREKERIILRHTGRLRLLYRHNNNETCLYTHIFILEQYIYRLKITYNSVRAVLLLLLLASFSFVCLHVCCPQHQHLHCCCSAAHYPPSAIHACKRGCRLPPQISRSFLPEAMTEAEAATWICALGVGDSLVRLQLLYSWR